MKLTNPLLLLVAIATAQTAPTTNAIWFQADTSEELVEAYPILDDSNNRTANSLILCPFLRLIERSGRLDDYVDDDNNIISVGDLKDATSDFGCDTTTACGAVVDTVSAGQEFRDGVSFSWFNPFRTRTVDLERLWDAPPISHECGFTFEPLEAAQQGVSSLRVSETLASLEARSSNGTLVYQDLLNTKNEICESEGVTATAAGILEAQLTFAFLGGVDRGFVDFSDVERFLQADSEMPLTKASRALTAPYVLRAALP